MYIHIYMIHFDVHLKLIQHCKSTIRQQNLKIKIKKIKLLRKGLSKLVVSENCC